MVGHGWLVSFLDKLCWDKLQLKFFFGGLMISMGNFVFGAVGFEASFFVKMMGVSERWFVRKR